MTEFELISLAKRLGCTSARAEYRADCGVASVYVRLGKKRIGFTAWRDEPSALFERLHERVALWAEKQKARDAAA